VLTFTEFFTTALKHNPIGARAVSLSPFMCRC